MHNRLYQLILIVLFSGFIHHANAGGGWVHHKGKGYFKLSQFWVKADKHFTDTGDIDPNVTIGYFNTSIYGEYGITDKLNAQIFFPFYSRSYHNAVISGTTGQTDIPGRAVNSIGDTQIGLKYGLVANGKIALSTHVWLNLPFGKNEFDPNGALVVPLLTGTGEFNQIYGFDLSTSKNFNNVNAFTSLGGQFNNRTNGYSDETRVNFEIGAVIFDKLILVYKLRWLNSLHNGDDTLENGSSLFSNNAEYLGYTYEIAYNATEKFGITFSYGSVYKAKLILASPAYSAGVYLNL
jgi:hypothetical protein